MTPACYTAHPVQHASIYFTEFHVVSVSVVVPGPFLPSPRNSSGMRLETIIYCSYIYKCIIERERERERENLLGSMTR